METKALTQFLEQYLIEGSEKKSAKKLLTDVTGASVLWIEDGQELIYLLGLLKNNEKLQFDFLSDLTAYDNSDLIDHPSKKFIVVYQFFSTEFLHRLRVKFPVDTDLLAPTVTSLWPGANWLEREVFDMYGIIFEHHPNLKRILMDERFTGFPLRKDYPMKLRESFSDNVAIDPARMHLKS